MKLTLGVKKVQVLTGRERPDQISIELDGESPFPSVGYPAYATIDVHRGYGIEWCRKVLGVEPDVIDVARPERPPFFTEKRK